MKVSELIAQLSAYNPEADVLTWTCDTTGDCMIVNRVIEWSNELTPERKRSTTEVFIHVTVDAE